MAETDAGWLRTHLGTVAAILGVGGTVLGAVVSFTLWYATVSGMAGKVAVIEPKMETLRKDLDTAENDIKRMQEALVSADRRMNDIRPPWTTTGASWLRSGARSMPPMPPRTRSGHGSMSG